MEQAIYLNIDYTNITHYFEIIYKREFGIRIVLKKLNRQLEKVADSFGNIIDI